jgi:hypothetical protein
LGCCCKRAYRPLAFRAQAHAGALGLTDVQLKLCSLEQVYLEVVRREEQV